MRQEALKENVVQVDRIAWYHDGEHAQNKVFISDRATKTADDYRLPDGTLAKMYGLEIELQCIGITNSTVLANVLQKICFDTFPADLFKLEEDGSLASDETDSSAECITQPMSRAFIRNHYKDFKTLFDVWFPSFGISATHTTDCGMHCHVSLTCFGATKETQDESIKKLYYFINRHYEFCCALFHRDPGATMYCRRMPHEKEYCKNLDLYNMSSSHGNCFNGSHYHSGNVEIRLIGGQKNYACFRNTMESLFFMIDRVKEASWNMLDDIPTFFHGCNRYVADRISSFCFRAGTVTESQVNDINAHVNQKDVFI